MWGVLTDGLAGILDAIYSVTGSYGLAIVVFTIITKMALYPLTVKQQRAMMDQKRLGPELQKIQEKYKKNKEELQKKTMEFYKENNFNPLGGCFPLIVQLPIIWLLFSVLRSHDFAEQGFLWVPLLTDPDPYYIWPVLSAGLTYVQGRLSSPAADPSGKSNTQNTMNMIMPIFIGFISLTFPAGLVLYWTVGTLVTIMQYYVINKKLEVPKEEVTKT